MNHVGVVVSLPMITLAVRSPGINGLIMLIVMSGQLKVTFVW